MIEPILPWSDLIYKTTCPLDLTAISNFCSTFITTESVHGLEKNNGKTTFNTKNNLLLESQCDQLKQWLTIVSTEVWRKWNFAEDVPRYMHRSWVNLHRNGDWTEEHYHGQVHQTIVIYLKQPVAWWKYHV